MIFVFDRDEQLVATLSNEDKQACPYFRAVLSTELNGPVTFEFEIPADNESAQHIKEDYMVAVKDREGVWQAFFVKELEHVHDESLMLSAFCEHIIVELADNVIESLAIDRKDSFGALTAILTGSRWEVGTTETIDVHDLTGQYITRLDALNTFLKRWKVEVRYRIEIAGQAITGRFIDVFVERGPDTGKRFEFDKDITEIRRTIETTNLKTALFGIGQEQEDGTIPTIESVNNGIKFIEDVEAREKYGFPKGDGTKWHRAGVYKSQSIEPAEILAETQEALERVKNPVVQYEAKVLDIARLANVPHEAVQLGARTTAIDNDLDMRLKARVIKLKYDLINDEETEITLGQFLPVYAETIERLENEIGNINFTIPADVLREAEPIKTEWLQGEIDALKNKVLAGSGSVTMTDTDGILIENNDKTQAIRLLGGVLAIASGRDASTGLYDWRTFGTGGGFTADLMTSGTMKFDRARGGTLALGAVPTGTFDASGNEIYQDGVLSLWSSDPSEGEIAKLSGDYKGFNALRIDELMNTQNVIFQTYKKTPLVSAEGDKIYYYVDPYKGDDSNTGTMAEPKNTIQNIIDGLPKYLNHDVYIYFIPGYLADSNIVIEGFLGKGSINIEKQKLIVRYIRDWANGSSSNTSNHWVEVNMTTETGGTVSARGDLYPERISTNAENANMTNIGAVSDGTSTTTAYWDAGNNNGNPVYVDIYLGGGWDNAKNLSVWKYHGDGRTYYGTKTEVSEDRSIWHTVFDSEREGTYAESSGGKKHYVNKGYLKGYFHIKNNTIDVNVYNLFIDGGKSASVTGYAYHTNYVHFRDCVFFGDPNSAYCVYGNGSNLRVVYCEVNTAGTAGIISAYGAQVEVYGCKGSGFKYGHMAHSSATLGGGGDGLLGSTANTHTSTGGFISGSWAHKSGEFSPITITTVTKTWTNTASDSWTEGDGSWRSGDDDVLQGKYSTYGPYRGLWFFGTAINSAVKGKTIKKVRVYVTRANSSGVSGDEWIRLMWHGYATKPSYAPSLGTSDVTSVALSRGESAWVDCTAKLAPKFKDGSAFGIGIWTADNSEYARMTQTCKVEITYEDVV